MEILESRALLAGDPTLYTVNLTGAAGAGSGAAGDLAYVVARANADADPDGGVIRFDPAVFSTPQTIALTATLALTATAGPIAIEGPGADLLTITGGDAVRVFRVDAGATAAISGLTVSNGRDTRGGGLANFGTLTLTQVAIAGNQAVGPGGGLGGARGGDGYGGGIYNAGALTIRDSAVLNNLARGGDGSSFWYYDCPSGWYWGCHWYGTDYPGGVGTGGGIANDGALTVVNATIAGNSALNGNGSDGSLGGGGLGGGIANSGTLALVFVTIADNTAGADSGGLWTSGGQAVTTSGASLFRNAGGNVAVGDGGAFRSLGHNLFSDAPGVAVEPTDLVAVDPRLGPLAANGGPTRTMALLPGSPAFDAGVAFDGVTTDQRGVARPQGAAPDIGAFESRAATFDVSAGTTIAYGTASTTFSGRIAGDRMPAGEVAVTLDGVTHLAAIDPATGGFAAVFATSGLHASASPYAVAYHYAGAVDLLAADAAGVLVVAPAALTIVADDQVVPFGADPPALTARYFGFVDGEGPADLTSPLVLATTAAAYSPPGRYPIVAWGAASPDYAVTFVDGVLTVARPTSPVLRRRVALVASLYRRALGRVAEPAGLRYWLGRLEAGSRSQDVAGRIWSSPEHRAQVRRLGDFAIGRSGAMKGGGDA